MSREVARRENGSGDAGFQALDALAGQVGSRATDYQATVRERSITFNATIPVIGPVVLEARSVDGYVGPAPSTTNMQTCSNCGQPGHKRPTCQY